MFAMLNHAFEKGGSAYAIRTAGKFIGIRAGHHAVVGLHGFKEVVDTVDGVEVRLHQRAPIRNRRACAVRVGPSAVCARTFPRQRPVARNATERPRKENPGAGRHDFSGAGVLREHGHRGRLRVKPTPRQLQDNEALSKEMGELPNCRDVESVTCVARRRTGRLV